jgi:hypothetical protein
MNWESCGKAMTRAQYQVFRRLAKKQTNRTDISVVDRGAQSVTFHVPFPGLYLTYDRKGTLMLTETEAERWQGGKRLALQQSIDLVIGGEVGSENYTPQKIDDTITDDDIPF